MIHLRRHIGATVLVVLLLAAAVAYYLQRYPLGYHYPIEQQNAMFDQLNQATLDELPPPHGAVAFPRVVSGVTDNIYGREWTIAYDYGHSSVAEVETYYLNLLSSRGWEAIPGGTMRIEGNEDYYAFRKGTGCIGLKIFYPLEGTMIQYDLSIWHDYYAQTFSPPKPNIIVQRDEFSLLPAPGFLWLCPPVDQ